MMKLDRMVGGHSDTDLPSVFFTYRLEDREEHLSPQELLAASESCEGVEPVKVYPFMGANGVPQHTSHHLNRRVLGEHNGDKENSNPRRGRGRVPGGRGELAKVHKTNITHNEDLTEMTEVRQTDHSQQVDLQLQRVARRDCYTFALDSTNPSLTGHSDQDVLGGVSRHEGETASCRDVPHK